MKNRHIGLILIFLLIAGLTSNALAIPNLQIYSPDGYYDTATETWMIPSYEYELWVIGANLDIYDVKLALAVPEGSGEGNDGSIDISWINPGAADYDSTNPASSITMQEIPYNYTTYRDSYEGNLTPESDTYGFGNGYPLDGNDKQLPGGGIFPSDFYEYFIGDFSPVEEVHNYIPGDEFLDTASGMIKKFHVSVTGYDWVDIIAYDHYIKSNNKLQYVKTPYSHDGGSGTPVPESATMLLFGTGIIGLAGIGRKKLKKNQIEI
jgi:hypothetical protein